MHTCEVPPVIFLGAARRSKRESKPMLEWNADPPLIATYHLQLPLVEVTGWHLRPYGELPAGGSVFSGGICRANGTL